MSPIPASDSLRRTTSASPLAPLGLETHRFASQRAIDQRFPRRLPEQPRTGGDLRENRAEIADALVLRRLPREATVRIRSERGNESDHK